MLQKGLKKGIKYIKDLKIFFKIQKFENPKIILLTFLKFLAK